jgi:hypothetical protein
MLVLRFLGSMPEDPEILQIEIQEFLSEHNVQIRDEAIKEIEKAFDNGEDAAEILVIQYEEDGNEYVMSLSREAWLQFLKDSLYSLSEQDEFELCIIAKRLVDKLENL